MRIQKFRATATITGTYYEDSTKAWTDEDEMWPARCPSKPNYVLNEAELFITEDVVRRAKMMEKTKA